MSPACDDAGDTSGDGGAGVLDDEPGEFSFSSSRSRCSSLATFARSFSVWLICLLSSK